jgi:hypothetical protein
MSKTCSKNIIKGVAEKLRLFQLKATRQQGIKAKRKYITENAKL